jgi:hypothetical protein
VLLQAASCMEPPIRRLRIDAKFCRIGLLNVKDAVAENTGRDNESVRIIAFRD